MSYELSLPVKIVALGGLVLALGAGAMLLLFGGHAAANEVVVAPTHHVSKADVATRHGTHPKTHAATSPKTRLSPVGIDPTLPTPIRRALAHHEVVVAIVYSDTNPLDTDAVRVYAETVSATNAGVATLDVAKEKTADAVVRSFPGAITPGLLIIRRPGKVVTELSGMQDPLGILQAISNAGVGAKSDNVWL